MSCERPASPIWAGIVVMSLFFSDMAVAGTLLPFFVDDVLSAPREWVGVAITLQYASATIGLVLSGYMADAIGLRRTVIIVGLSNVLFVNLAGHVRSIGAMLVVRCCIGLSCTYALGLSWVAAIAPRERLARWMAASVCIAQASIMVGGFVAGAMRGRDLAIAGAIVSALPALAAVFLMGAREVPRTASAGGESQRAGLLRAVRTRFFCGVAIAPFVQGASVGGVMQVLTPLILKSLHGWEEASVARVFQFGGLVALVAHATATPYLSSRPWRHRALQALSLLVAALLLAYGMLGEAHPAAALVLPVAAFVGTAVALGIANFMIALLARAVAPAALGTLTGLTRCAFTLGYCSLPAALVPLLAAGGLLAPCALVASLFGLTAISLQLCSALPAAAAPPTLTVESHEASGGDAEEEAKT